MESASSKSIGPTAKESPSPLIDRPVQSSVASARFLDLIGPLISHLRLYENVESGSSVNFGIRPLDVAKAQAAADYLADFGFTGDATQLRQGIGRFCSLYADLLQRPDAPEDDSLLHNRVYGLQAEAVQLVRLLQTTGKLVGDAAAVQTLIADAEPAKSGTAHPRMDWSQLPSTCSDSEENTTRFDFTRPVPISRRRATTAGISWVRDT